MNILDVLSNTTLAAISTDVQAAMVLNAQQYAEEEFLYGRIGTEHTDLQYRAEFPVEHEGLWNQPGNVGNDPGSIGAGKPTAGYNFTPGKTATLSAKGPAGAYANVYLYMRLPTPTTLPKRLVDSRTFQIQDLSGWQALEFQSQITMAGLTYNLAWQANIVKKVWRVFNFTATQWMESLSIPFPDFTKPVILAAAFALDGQSATHVTLTINGTKYPVGIQQAATPTKNADKFTTAVQIDPKPGGSCALQISQHDVRFAL